MAEALTLRPEHCDRELATEVHHEPPLKLLLARGLSPYANEFLVSLCHACHAKQTRLEQQGGREGSGLDQAGA